MYRPSQLIILAFVAGVCNAASAANVAVRAENFTVPPATGPVTHILARNMGDAECTIAIEPEFPAGWRWTPANREVTLLPNEVKRLPFTIEKASDEKSNRYAIEIAVIRGSKKSVYGKNVVCASAPYFKPKIDGKFKDWADAIPVTFTTAGRKTIVSTYWNKRSFYLYVQVEEDKLYSYKKNAARVDAVQFALASSNSVTPSKAQAEAQRSEFLLVDVGGMFGKDKCFQLIEPGQEVSVTQEKRSVEPLQLKDAQVAVKRQGKITHYECAIPFAAIPTIRPAVGREIRFSVLVHDPDGTGIRDWGKAAGLWPGQRNPLAWCKWSPAKWPADPPYDGKVEFGLCSSKR
jgi:hypothetical protein